jgi:hypothetical protein
MAFESVIEFDRWTLGFRKQTQLRSEALISTSLAQQMT